MHRVSSGYNCNTLAVARGVRVASNEGASRRSDVKRTVLMVTLLVALCAAFIFVGAVLLGAF